MSIADLRVIHIPHFSSVSSSSTLLPVLNSQPVFQLNTCQRSLWVYRGSSSSFFAPSAPRDWTFLTGESAYQLLLSVACGLESQILGETNIFGQIKEAWDRFSTLCPQSNLKSIFHHLFEDTKDIRANYLQNMGNTSYGALVRKLLKNNLRSPILLVGAGDIAQSVAPWLLEHELWLMNRDPQRLQTFAENLAAEPQARIRIIQKSEEAQALTEASHWVFCIPYDPVEDPHRIQLRNSHPTSSVIHLAGSRDQAGVWNSISNFYCLDDLFALQESQGEFRNAQLRRARKACADRAKLRAFGSSLSIAHGWEYLAAFC